MQGSRNSATLSPAMATGTVLSQTLWIGIFAAMTAVGARIAIPHDPVPYTLQTFFVLLSGAFLGSRNGAISQGVYLLLGSTGLPVFAGSVAGVAVFGGPSAGYLLGFPVAAALVGFLIRRSDSYPKIVLSMFLGLSVIFLCGSLLLQWTVFHDWGRTVVNGLLIFSWWDLLKLSAAAAIYRELSKRYRQLGTNAL